MRSNLSGRTFCKVSFPQLLPISLLCADLCWLRSSCATLQTPACKCGLIYQLGLVVKPEIKRWRATLKCLRYTWLNRQTRARTRSRTHRHDFGFEGAHIDQTSGEPAASHSHTNTIHTDTQTDSLCVYSLLHEQKNPLVRNLHGPFNNNNTQTCTRKMSSHFCVWVAPRLTQYKTVGLDEDGRCFRHLPVSIRFKTCAWYLKMIVIVN